MNKAPHSFATQSNWFDLEAGDIDAFAAQIPAATDPADWPNAAEVVRSVLIYDGAAIRAMDATAQAALMGEWARAFLAGPGIVVIKGAYDDLSVLDRATDLFTRMIEQERQSGAGGGDHFAKPGANDRVWNALQKHCLADPEGFALYYGNICLELVSTAWLGPNYQFTAQVNRVNPGGTAQTAHRDYHLGFMTREDASRWPVHAHLLSPALTLQGAVAHVDMPLKSGPTLYLPYSQRYPEGYIAFNKPEFQAYFAQHHVQLPLEKGDAAFFNPALMHGAGNNVSSDILRLANLLQVSSAFGRPIETVDRGAMARALLEPLQTLLAAGRLSEAQAHAAIAATAEGYAYPTNLDTDPPVGGLAPLSQAEIMRRALAEGTEADGFARLMDDWDARRQA
ncbi:Protein involved in biosynthesis of mitomycin antibiotics/polyketide fumonisin [Candidatus Rhodobacter oscarellae]|uniref:Protein involved in biosynthesis of mitomycin antibiotics/polyketide fumonisin n=1 Tax=Candidatus Rhodobacter oscarellae TaxID=1675527 RepID=A0A0J9E5E1_9RHOB|nr:phytanoyl-CoA dioxygenase family protein [Candidatus Rhodobacter lobularis]KMW57911.1 Protein involved in biosynthesis of mitomycin antibiotics/polyketide fumonisin [Candidatus Rhodobacter lobularis]